MIKQADTLDHLLIKASCGKLEVVIDDTNWLDVIPMDQLAVSLKRTITGIGQQFNGPLGCVAMSLSNDKRVAELNGLFRGKNYPTNVLSFPQGDDLQDDQLGDIILAFETCVQEAENDEKPFLDHFLHLVVHGWLHLLGFDHTNEADASEMEDLEQTILASLNIPDPFDGDKFVLDKVK